jgi:hypothetical protein
VYVPAEYDYDLNSCSGTSTVGIAKIDPAGVLDTSFGNNGWYVEERPEYVTEEFDYLEPVNIIVNCEGELIAFGTNFRNNGQVDLFVIHLSRTGEIVGGPIIIPDVGNIGNLRIAAPNNGTIYGIAQQQVDIFDCPAVNYRTITRPW